MSSINSVRSPEVERWFDINISVSPDWLKDFFNLMAQYCKNPTNIRCEFWMKPNCGDKRLIFYDRSTIIDFITENWNQIEETVVSQYEGPLYYALLNHQYHYIRIRIEKTDDWKVDNAFSSFQEKLSLSLSEPLPYKYRRSSLEFEIGQWNPKNFVIGLRNIENLIGPNPYVDNAYVKSFDGDVEKLTPFFDLQSFLAHIDRNISTFGEVALLLKVRSTTIGIFVPTDHKKLRIRTSIVSSDLDPIVEAWPKELQLKPIKAVDSGAFFSGNNIVESDEKPFVKYGVPILTAFITAFSVTSAVSLKKAIWPDYKIVVTSPILEDSKTALSGKHVIVDWYLQPDQQSFRNVIKDSVAKIHLRSSTGEVKEMISQSPVSIDIPPGDYGIVIDVDNVAPVNIKLKIKEDKPQSSITGKL